MGGFRRNQQRENLINPARIMAPSPQQDNQLWRFMNQPLTAGVILFLLSVICAGLLRISNQLNELSDGQKLGLIEIGNLKEKTNELEASDRRQDKDIVLLQYQVRQR
jgi:hypothetical protein